jgi:GT2 family glycosyltransferase
MKKVAINLVRFNQSFEELVLAVDAALAQDYGNFTFTFTENGSKENIKELMINKYESNPHFSYKENDKNLGFAGAHNKFFNESDAELVMPLNPDAIMQPGFISALVVVFEDPTVGSAEGKMLKPEVLKDGSHLIDGTGLVVSRSRRARERGQLQKDLGQYDTITNIFGVSGTAPMYRKSALEKVRIGDREYFDEDFFAYWEDLDLAWRLRLAGYKAVYVPNAVIYHSRAVGQSKSGYKNPLQFVKHHSKFSVKVKRWNWRNHLFAIIKNDFGSSFWRDSLFILGREAAMFVYVIFFEPSTLGAIPDFLKLLPKMIAKRKSVKRMRVVSSAEIGKWFLQKQMN